jgi:hypothetical protein
LIAMFLLLLSPFANVMQSSIQKFQTFNSWLTMSTIRSIVISGLRDLVICALSNLCTLQEETHGSWASTSSRIITPCLIMPTIELVLLNLFLLVVDHQDRLCNG